MIKNILKFKIVIIGFSILSSDLEPQSPRSQQSACSTISTECKLCFEDYNQTDRRKETLPCDKDNLTSHHTLCSACKSSVIEFNNQCPWCRSIIDPDRNTNDQNINDTEIGADTILILQTRPINNMPIGNAIILLLHRVQELRRRFTTLENGLMQGTTPNRRAERSVAEEPSAQRVRTSRNDNSNNSEQNSLRCPNCNRLFDSILELGVHRRYNCRNSSR